MTRYKFVYIIILILLTGSCRRGIYPLVPEDVRNTIDASGKNYIEFIEAITAFRAPRDSLKLHSLYYLIGNMKGQGLKTHLLQDSTGILVDYNIREHDSYNKLIAFKDSIDSRRGPLHFIKHYYGSDSYAISAGDLINHVNLTFGAWQNKSWSSAYPFDVFCSKVLPYRMNDAHLDSLRQNLKILSKADFTLKTNDVFQMAGQVVKKVERDVTFDKRYVEHPTDRMLQWGKNNQRGRTEDAAVLAVSMLRRLGIACAIDFVPYPKESGKRVDYWIAVWDTKGETKRYFPFADSLEVISQPVKVFRRTFNTYNHPLPNDSVFRLLKYQHLKSGKYKDVTSEYRQTVSWRVEPEELGVFDKFNPVILFAETPEGWMAIDWRYFTKTHLFRELSPNRKYALKTSEGKVLLEKYLPLKTN